MSDERAPTTVLRPSSFVLRPSSFVRLLGLAGAVALAGLALLVGQPWTDVYGQTAGIPPTRVPPVVTAIVAPEPGGERREARGQEPQMGGQEPGAGSQRPEAEGQRPEASEGDTGSAPAPLASRLSPLASAPPAPRLVWDGAGVLQLSIPGDAFSRPFGLTISEVAASEVPPPPAGLRFGTTIRRVSPDPGAGPARPARPLSLVVRFTPEDLAGAGGLTSGLRLVLWPVGAPDWIDLPAQVDAAGGLLHGELASWGVLAVAGVIPRRAGAGGPGSAVAKEPALSAAKGKERADAAARADGAAPTEGSRLVKQDEARPAPLATDGRVDALPWVLVAAAGAGVAAGWLVLNWWRWRR